MTYMAASTTCKVRAWRAEPNRRQTYRRHFSVQVAGRCLLLPLRPWFEPRCRNRLPALLDGKAGRQTIKHTKYSHKVFINIPSISRVLCYSTSMLNQITITNLIYMDGPRIQTATCFLMNAGTRRGFPFKGAS